MTYEAYSEMQNLSHSVTVFKQVGLLESKANHPTTGDAPTLEHCDTHGAIIPAIAMYIFTYAYHLRIFNLYTVFPPIDAAGLKYTLGH